jgi:flagellar hook-associated protein 2
MEAAVAANTRRKTALADLAAQLRALHEAAGALRTGTAPGGAFAAFTTAADGKDANGRLVLAAAAAAGAQPGTHAVEVTRLAAAERLTAGVGFAAGAPLPAAGSFSLTRAAADGTVATLGTVTVDASSTLASVRDAVNRLNTGASPSGVTATLVGVGPDDQRLVLTATGTGAANAFALADGGAGVVAALGLDPADATAPARRQPAQDAEFTVDGLPVTRATNTASDVLAGVTLTLTALGRTELTVARNAQAASDAARAFVDAYNKVVGTAKAQSGVGKPLAGDGLARTLRASLSARLLAPAAGDDVAADLATPGVAGLAVQKDGTLKLDAAAFQAAAGDRLPELAAMLAATMGAVADFADTASRPITGALDERGRALDDRNATLQDRVAAIDDRLAKRRTALLTQYARSEAAIGRLQSIQSTMSSQFASLAARRTPS